jgi:hypothetical protein
VVFCIWEPTLCYYCKNIIYDLMNVLIPTLIRSPQLIIFRRASLER